MPRSAPHLVALLVLLHALAGCMSHRHEPYGGIAPVGAYTMPAVGGAGYYEYRAEPPRAEYFEIPARQVPGYRVSGLRFPALGYNGQPDNLVQARYFRAPGAAPRPLLIVLPIWGTHTFPSTVIANGYARHAQGAAHVLWMQGDEPLFDWFGLAALDEPQDWLEEIDRSIERFRNAAVDVRRLLDWAQTRPEIDSSRIGVVGFSMSALVAANVAGNDRRIHTAVYMVGGARPWDLMAECGVVVDYMRRHALKTMDWELEEFRAFFRQELAYGDPARWRGRYRPENTLIIESTRDDCVPEAARESFWLATGRPERILFPYNHWQPFLAMTPVGLNSLNRDIFEFLDRKLILGDGADLQPYRRRVSAP